LFELQDENTKLYKEGKTDAGDENEDGEEKKDQEKSLEDSLEKPLVVSFTGVFVYCSHALNIFRLWWQYIHLHLP